MTSALDRLAPGWLAKANLATDLALLTSVSVLAGWDDRLAFAAAAIWLVMSASLRLYNPWSERQALDDAAMLIISTVAVGAGLAGLALSLGLKRELTPLIAFAGATIALRSFFFRPLAARQKPEEEVLVVGTGPFGRATGAHLARRRRWRVYGYMSFADERAEHRHTMHYLGSVAGLAHVLADHAISVVYVAGSPLRQAAEMQEVIRTCEELGVPFALPAYSFRLERSRPAHPAWVRDGYVHYMSTLCKPGQMGLKRLFDIAVSAGALCVLLPLFAVVALLIKATSPGPVLFRQVRSGLHGKPFNFLKFRSMVVNAEALKARLAEQNEQAGPVFKMKHDPRITPIGRFLRKYSIDELPQLVNVLRGDMSLVGPRPPLPSEVAKYERWQRRRLSMRPGLTCYWQVSGRNEISFEQWMYLDMQYIDHWSLGQDLALLFKTVPVVVTGRGAS